MSDLLDIALMALVKHGEDNCYRKYERDRKAKPTNVKKFPGAKVGDILFACDDTLEGVWRWIVVSVLDDDEIIAARCDFDRLSETSWGVDWMHATLKDALQAAVDNDLEFHEPRLKHVQMIRRAIKEGGSLEAFMDGAPDLT